LTCKAFEKTLKKNYHGRLFEDHIEEPRVFAAVLNEEPIGWIELGHEKWNNRMRVWELLVKEEYRGRGVGKLLMNQAVRTAKEKGARMLVLETQTNNSDAISFYLSFGFELIGFDTAAYSNEDIEKKEVRLELGMRL
jgi:ribosomal protein S18 acetylase RimI-like enzyme